MLARRAMMGRPVARAVVGTAVVAGTAGVVRHQQNKRWARQDAAAQQQYDQAYQQGAADAQSQQQYAPPPEQYGPPPGQYGPPPGQYAPPPAQYAAPVAPPPAADLTAQLQQIAQLHEAGVLSDEEFAAAKQKLLAA